MSTAARGPGTCNTDRSGLKNVGTNTQHVQCERRLYLLISGLTVTMQRFIFQCFIDSSTSWSLYKELLLI